MWNAIECYLESNLIEQVLTTASDGAVIENQGVKCLQLGVLRNVLILDNIIKISGGWWGHDVVYKIKDFCKKSHVCVDIVSTHGLSLYVNK